MAAEFTCAECGLPPQGLAAVMVPKVGLCTACVLRPLWFRDEPDLRNRLAPDHDGRELVERRMPNLAMERDA